MQTFTPVESTEPLKNLETVKEAEKPEEGKGNHFILRDAL